MADPKPGGGRAIRARTRVQVTIEILNQDVWGEDATVGQIRKDAVRSALDWFNKFMVTTVPERIDDVGRGRALQVIGEPKVVCVLTEER